MEAPSLVIDLNLKTTVVEVLHLAIGLYGAGDRCSTVKMLFYDSEGRWSDSS